MASRAGEPESRRATAANTAKVAARRRHTRTVDDLQPSVAKTHENHLIPPKDITELLEGDLDRLRPVGTVIAGVDNFKVLRGSVAVLSLETSIEYAHIITDASLIGRGRALVCDLYAIDRSNLFDDDPDDADTDGADDDDGD